MIWDYESRIFFSKTKNKVKKIARFNLKRANKRYNVLLNV